MRTEEVTPRAELYPSNGATAHTAAGRANFKAVRPWFRKKRFVLPPALLLALLIVLAAGGGLGGTSETAKSTTRPTFSGSAAARIGTMLRDGRLEFVVTGVDRPGRTLAGKAGETLTAKGEFVIVRVNVTNTGNDTRPPNCSCQFVFNDQGHKFPTSPAILSTKETLKFVQRISPGDTVDGVLMLFDVPTGTKVVNIELHETPTSPGVKVRLS